MAERVKIGTATLTRPAERRLSYETAAWSKTVQLEPQTADVYAEVEDGKVVDTSIGWTFEGVVVDSHFPALFGGVAYSSGERPGDLGKREVVHSSPYAHAVALSQLKGEPKPEVDLPTGDEGKEVELALDCEALYVPFADFRGQGRYSAGLFLEPTHEEIERSRGVEAALSGQPIPHDSPEATFGWAMARQSQARSLEEEAKRTRDMADYALRTYAPELQPKPELDGLEH